jgi:hypothetical protein
LVLLVSKFDTCYIYFSILISDELRVRV